MDEENFDSVECISEKSNYFKNCENTMYLKLIRFFMQYDLPFLLEFKKLKVELRSEEIGGDEFLIKLNELVLRTDYRRIKNFIDVLKNRKPQNVSQKIYQDALNELFKLKDAKEIEISKIEIKPKNSSTQIA